MKIAVTGVAGLLGSHYARWMKDLGHQVIGVDNLSGGYLSNVPKDIEFLNEDILKLDKMIEALNGVDIVFHAACNPYEGLSVFSPNTITLNTYQNTISVATAAIKNNVKKFIFCSSMARYGYQEVVPFHENQIPNPIDPYGIAKYAAEQTLSILSKVHGMELIVVVPHNIYGPNQKFDDPYRNVVSIMINRIINGKPPIIYGDGNQTRSFTYIDDIKESLINATFNANLNGETINIGPDNNAISINQLCEIILQKLNSDLTPIYYADRPQEVKHAQCSADKARRLLGYEPKISVNDGISNLIEWIISEGKRDFDYSIEIEIENEKTPRTWLLKEM